MTNNKKTIPLLLSAALLSIPMGAQALSYSFLADSPERYMNQEDYRIQIDAVKDLLENGKEGAKRTWTNPTTKNSGMVKILLSYKDGDLNCRRTAMVSKIARGLTERSVVNLCKIGDEWKIKEWPANAFNDEDWKLFDQAAQDVMENAKDGASKAWKNEQSGNAGTFKPLSTTKSGDQKCRTVNVTITTRQGQKGETTLNMCRNADGTWKRAGSAPSEKE